MPNPSVDEDLIDGFSISENRGLLSMTRTFHCKDLVGADPVTIFSSALKLTATAGGGAAHDGADVPGELDSATINGKTIYVQSRVLEPWPPCDAIVKVNYGPNPRAFTVNGMGPITWDVGSVLQQSETDFDYANLQLAWNSRVPISVGYTPSGGSAKTPQTKTCPYFVPMVTITATREEQSSPESRAMSFVGFTNSGTWRGYAANTVLCMEVRGRNPQNAGVWTTSYRFGIDLTGLWKKVIYWIDPTTGFAPALTATDLTNSNGVKQVTVQGSADFAPLAIA